jgi:hypothetical protein
MWILFSLAALVWFLSVHLYLPLPIIFGLFAVMIGAAAAALLAPQSSQTYK